MPWRAVFSACGLCASVLLVAILGLRWHLHAQDTASLIAPAASDAPAAALGVPAGTPPLPALLSEAAADVPIVTWVAGSLARFEPCGCVAGMRGGLLRRASLLARLPASRLLSVELGGWSAGAGAAQSLRMDAYLVALATAGVRCVAVGEDEITLGGGALAGHLATGMRAQLHLLCANLVDGAGRPVAEASCILTVAGRQLLVTAVTRAGLSADGLSTTDPAAAARAVLARSPTLPLVILADLDEAGLHELARAVPAAQLVVGGRVTTPTALVSHEGAVRIIHVANHGKTVGWWPWGAEHCAFELLDEHVPDHPAMVQALAAHERSLSSVVLAEDDLHQAQGYVGGSVCITCHVVCGRVHAGSGHARSLAALTRRGYDHDPECLACHVTALGESDGFSRLHPVARPDLAAVSCESCHGPGHVHVAAKQGAQHGDGGLVMATAATCVRCHDTENSPQFDFAAYWPRILHGKDTP
jgi:hypothetical protein